MRRAGQKNAVSRPSPTKPVAAPLRAASVAELDLDDPASASHAPAADETTLSSGAGFATSGPLASHDPTSRRQQLPLVIRQRIESRLPGRVRNLVVRLLDETVVLEGQCATYYTKQLAQHAALGILEHDEHLENEIVVNVPR